LALFWGLYKRTKIPPKIQAEMMKDTEQILFVPMGYLASIIFTALFFIFLIPSLGEIFYEGDIMGVGFALTSIIFLLLGIFFSPATVLHR